VHKAKIAVNNQPLVGVGKGGQYLALSFAGS
jgi:hypothetical protein